MSHVISSTKLAVLNLGLKAVAEFCHEFHTGSLEGQHHGRLGVFL